MKFRTEIALPKSSFQINHHNRIFSIGSCFAQNISENLSQHGFTVLSNPFGNLFNVISIENAMLRMYSRQYYNEEELFEHQGITHSWDHHSDFSAEDPQKVLENINRNIDQANEFLQNTDRFILTLGSSFYYVLQEFDLPVSNCHQVPQNYFRKQLLSVSDTLDALQNIQKMAEDIAQKKVHFVVTVSPVKHLKDGIIENKRSKAIALEAIHQWVENQESILYFPAFEIQEEELRDYRFYNSAMTHPSEQAIQYIWNRFSTTFFDEKTQSINQEIEALQMQQNHKSRFPNSAAHQLSIQNLQEKRAQFLAQNPHIKI